MKLRDYQIRIARKGLQILQEKGIVYLAMETRTGKTLTALQIAQDAGRSRILFVTKKKAITGIQKDCLHFPGLSVTVINYESVHKINDKFDLAIIDEAHALGQYPRPSKRYKDLRKITFNLPCVCLSATPSPESYSQLFHQFSICGFHPWSRYKNFYRWADRYVNKKTKYIYNRELTDYSEARQDLIDQATREYFISFTQTEAGIVNQVEEQILYCDMKPGTLQIIETLNRDRVVYFPKGLEILADTPVKLMSKVQQISSGTVKGEDGSRWILDKSKAEYILNYFKGQKIAIYYKFIAEGDLLVNTFPDATTIPEDFQQGKSDVFISQFSSGREGIRLDAADAIVFYNIDFSFLSYEQAKNRIVSMERDTPARMYWIFSQGGIEKKIYKTVVSKKDYTLRHYIRDYDLRKHNTAQNYQRG
jgi:hypothetical protein